MQLEKIVWPVFKLRDKEPINKDGIIYYLTELFDEENNKTITKIKIIDDKNITNTTLGLRRLKIDKDKLEKLSIAIYTVQDLIKLATKSSWFIDNNGTIFQYKKSTRAKLKIYRIKQILPVNGIGCILELEGLSERFKSMTIPIHERYAAILHYNSKSLFYGLCNEELKSKWRLV